MAVKKRGFYSPWGYMEENDYQSSENQFEVELNDLIASASYNKDDKKIHFFNNDGKDLSGSTIDTTSFAPGVVQDAYYDSTTKELVIVFDGGSTVRINMTEIIDENEFADGLQVDSDGIVSVKIDGASDPYLSVGSDGIKLSGVEAAINNEKQRAISAETALQEAINNEIARATSAETILDSKIELEKTRAEEAEAELQAAIEAEETRATSAETDLQTAIEAEKQRAEDAESALQDNIDAEETRATSAESTLNDKIDQEIADRIVDVDAEETRAKAAESALSDTLNAEIARSTREDEIHDDELRILDSRVDLLASKVDNEIARATSAETTLNNKIDAEETRAKAVEETLQDAIDTEETRATSAETELNNRVDELVEELQPLLNDTLVTTNDKEVAFGKYNVSSTGDEASGRTAFSIGNGTDDANRSNAFEVRENGDVYAWVEGDYMQINRLLAMLAHEVYDDDSSNNG